VKGESVREIAARIRVVRGQRVLLDVDLATLYAVPVKSLNQAVKRNLERFPEDFMFHLTWNEAQNLRSQFVTLRRADAGKAEHGKHSKYRPFAFTEQGVAMLSSVLKSPRAVRANIEIMRAFVRMRRMLIEHADLAARIEELERRYDGRFRAVFDAIRELATPPPATPRRRIGFVAQD
jgi:hypothetical protein